MATAQTRFEPAPAAELLSPLPDPVEVGKATVLYLEGRCEPRADRGSVRVAIGNRDLPVEGELLPEPGQSGAGRRWWVLAELDAGDGIGPRPLELRFRVGGTEQRAPLGTVTLALADRELAPPAPTVSAAPGRALIAICMATHEPDLGLLERQLDSIREQDRQEWVCVISDDASSAERWNAILALTERDPRFIASRSPRRLGFYRNFERALRMVPVEAEYVALSDQDDRWDRDKLSALYEELAGDPGRTLAYSDMRIVDGAGSTVSETYWILRRNNHESIASMLVANTVTGAASLFRASLLDDALPFPPPVGDAYHDHWLALCALASGRLAYLDRPTYDRTRHLDSVTADTRHARALQAMAAGEPDAARAGRRSLRERVRAQAGGRAAFERYLMLCQLAAVLELRLGDRIEPSKRRVLRRFRAARRSLPALAWLALRSLRSLAGRNETMARERVLASGVLWWRRERVRSRLAQRS